MKRNLILSLAMLAISVSSFAFNKQAKPCDTSKQESSMQKGDRQKQKHKKEKKQQKEQQDSGGFSIYG